MTDSLLEDQLRTWGRAKRKLLGVPNQPRSIFGRIQDEGSVGAAIRGQPPDPPEVMLGVALLVARARRTCLDDHAISYVVNEILDEHYVKHGPPRRKARKMGISPKTYYQRLNQARIVIAPYIAKFDAEASPDIY